MSLMTAAPIPSSVGRFSPLGPRGILVLDLVNGISGFAKSNQHSLGEVDTFFVTFRDLVPRRAVPSRLGKFVFAPVRLSRTAGRHTPSSPGDRSTPSDNPAGD